MVTHQIDTILERLEAGIFEDEKAAERAMRSPRPAISNYKQVSPSELLVSPKRVLAECAAKREIIALYREAARDRHDEALEYFKDILKALAAAYQ